MFAQTLTRENTASFVKEFFTEVDVLSVPGTMKYFDADATVQFGNNLGIKGEADLEQLIIDWSKLFDRMYHDVRNISIDVEQNTIFVTSMISYFMKGNAEKDPVTIPGMSVMKLLPLSKAGEMKLEGFRVYFDPKPIYEKSMGDSSEV